MLFSKLIMNLSWLFLLSNIFLVNSLYATIMLHDVPTEMTVLITGDGVVRDTIAVLLDDKLFFYRAPV